MREFDEIRSEVKVARKPYDLSDVPTTLVREISPRIQNLISKLPIIDGNHLDFSEEGDGFFNHVLDGDVQFYIVEIGDKRLFVDTQGYEYARYVGEIKK